MENVSFPFCQLNKILTKLTFCIYSLWEKENVMWEMLQKNESKKERGREKGTSKWKLSLQNPKGEEITHQVIMKLLAL